MQPQMLVAIPSSGESFQPRDWTQVCISGRFFTVWATRASQVALVVKNLPANAGDITDVGSIPGSGRSLEGGHGNPLRHSCLENPMDRGAWRATVHGVTKNQTQLKRLSTHTLHLRHRCIPLYVHHTRLKRPSQEPRVLDIVFLSYKY